MTSNGALIFLMAFLFLGLGYMGVPVAFALIASVLGGHGIHTGEPRLHDGATVQRHGY